jgi:hypothetical protein
MKPSLGRVTLKLQRADEHLAILNDRVAALKAENRDIVCKFDPHAGECVLRVSGKPPPIEWGVILSEWAHLMRSALDNLVYAVVRGHGATPHDRSEFPIYRDEPRYTEGIQARIDGVKGHERTFIDETQPFQVGEPWSEFDPLWQLHRLNNIDKHRLLHAAYVANIVTVPIPTHHNRTVRRQVPYFRFQEKLVTALLKPGGPPMSLPGMTMPFPVQDVAHIKDGWRFRSAGTDDPTEIARVPIEPNGPNPQVEMKPRPTVDISLGDPEMPALIADLFVIRDRVNEIVGFFL